MPAPPVSVSLPAPPVSAFAPALPVRPMPVECAEPSMPWANVPAAEPVASVIATFSTLLMFPERTSVCGVVPVGANRIVSVPAPPSIDSPAPW